jgi:uncharacterized membrane protein YkvA (DUF1232 family)
MGSNLPAKQDNQVSLLAGVINQIRLVWLLFRDNRVSMWAKSVLPLSVIYTISPIDFIPDVILGFGQLDDLGIILLGMALFLRLAPPDLVEYYRQIIEFGDLEPGDQMDDIEIETVDTTFQVLEDSPVDDIEEEWNDDQEDEDEVGKLSDG